MDVWSYRTIESSASLWSVLLSRLNFWPIVRVHSSIDIVVWVDSMFRRWDIQSNSAPFPVVQFLWCVLALHRVVRRRSVCPISELISVMSVPFDAYQLVRVQHDRAIPIRLIYIRVSRLIYNHSRMMCSPGGAKKTAISTKLIKNFSDIDFESTELWHFTAPILCFHFTRNNIYSPSICDSIE